MNYRLTFTLLILISATGLSCIKSYAQRHSNRSLKQAIEEFTSDPALKNSSWGFMAAHADSGKEILSVNPDLALIPASTQKVVTTLTSLALLGKDYQFETLLQYEGSVQNQVLTGNLIIRGSGDPTLGAVQLHDSLALEKVLERWLTDLKVQGIRSIQGNIIADGSWFDDHLIPPKWMWEDMGNYYGAGAHALSVNENMYTLFFEPGRQVGETAKVLRTQPDVSYLKFKDDVTTGPARSGDRVYIYGSPYSDERWLTGTVPLGESNFPVRGSLPDPGLFLAYAFRVILTRNNITLTGDIFTHRSAPAGSPNGNPVTISRRASPSLLYIAERTNLNSVNTYAENLIKTLGKQFGSEGSYAAGSQVSTGFWKDNGLDTDGLRLHDGSGLSPYNNITARQLTGMLVFAAADQSLYESLTLGLPVAGRTGTLANLFRGTRSEGVLMAKSGFLGNVRAYSGYTRCRNGNLIAFTFIVNNYGGSAIEMRNKMVKVMDAITGSGF